MIIDISMYQGKIDWQLVNKEIELVIMRSSIDYRIDDRYFEYSSKCAVPYGVYHFLKAKNVEEAKKEADFFYKTATNENRKPLFFCADIEYETITKENVRDISRVFAETLRNYGVNKIGIYIGQELYPYADLNKYDFIWIPRYGLNTGEADENYSPKYPCDLWQYTSNGRVNGIPERVDISKLWGNKSLNWFTNENSNKFSNINLVKFAKDMLDQPYWYGTCVYKCSESLLERKTSQYPEHYTKNRLSQYKQNIKDYKICTDCIGLIKGFIWTDGGEKVSQSIGIPENYFKNIYQSNEMPDKSADGMFEYAKSIGLSYGSIETIPEIPGIAVRYNGHVGIYIGDGEVIEARGFNYGVVQTKLKDRNWTDWYKIPCIQYGGEVVPVLGRRILKKGMEGEDVKELQTLLNEVMNDNLEVDGDFGSGTDAAVRAFQKKYGLIVDGEFGPASYKKLIEIKPKSKILIANGNVNIRKGNSTDYEIIRPITVGTTLIPILDKNGQIIISNNNWYAVKINEQIGWVSEKYVMEG